MAGNMEVENNIKNSNGLVGCPLKLLFGLEDFMQ